MKVEYSVLIIDDDKWMQRILTKTLQIYGFHKVYLASNGFEGIAKAVEYVPSLIITDILMPELSGHQVLRILKTINATKRIPVIMLSAMSDAENVGIAVKGGIAGFISKPFSSATIYDKLLQIFGKDKLDLIFRGEMDEKIIQDDYMLKDNDILPEFNFNIGNLNSKIFAEDEKASNTNLADELGRQYGEDERKSIASIKKLLTKSK